MSKMRYLWLLIFALLAGTVACGPQKVGTETGNLSGDVTGPPWANTAAGLKGSALPSLASCLSAGGYLLWNGSAWTCGAGGVVAPTGTGLWYNSSGSLNGAAVTLTGDVSQGALSGGNVPLTVTAVQGKSITLATGLLEYTGSAFTFVSGGSLFTPGGDLTGNATQQYVQSLSGASGSGSTVTIASNVTSLQPSDNVTALGSASHRLLSSNAGPTGFQVWGASGAANPVAALINQAVTFGGGTLAVDTRFVRTGAGAIQFDNNAGGDGVLQIGGSLASGGHYITLQSSTATISLGGTGPSGAQSAGLTLSAQAVNATNGGAGNVIAQYAAATGTGAEGAFAVKRGTSTYATIQGWVSGPTSLAGLYFGVGITPSAGNHTILSDGTSSTYFNAPATMVFQIAGTSEVDLNSTTLSPAAPGGIANGTAANYWNGVYSSAFAFPAGLGANGTIGWSAAAASGAGFDTYVQAQPPMSGGTFNGGSIYLMSGGQNGGTGVQGNVVASIGANTSHLWSPNAKGTFQVIDGSGLNLVAGNYAAVSSGTATLSALWLGAGSTGFTPSNTNYAAKADGTNLFLNAPSGGLLEFGVGNTTYATISSTAFAPNAAGGITDGTTADYWGANYTADRQTLAVSGSASGATDVIKRRTYLALGGTSTVVVPSGTGPTITSPTGARLEFHWQARDPTATADVAGGVTYAICRYVTGTLTCTSNSLWSTGQSWCTGSVLPTVVVGVSGSAVTLTGTCAGAGASTIWEADVLFDNQ